MNHRTKGFFVILLKRAPFGALFKFIELDSFTLTQRRDSSILDKEMTKRYGGVKTYKDIVIVDTLGFVSVKDSLFGADNRYTKMMYVPGAEDDNIKFELKSGFIEQNGLDIPVFECKVDKSVILFDQNIVLINKENLVQSVDGVNVAVDVPPVIRLAPSNTLWSPVALFVP